MELAMEQPDIAQVLNSLDPAIRSQLENPENYVGQAPEIARRAAALSVVKNGLPVPAAMMITRPFSR